MTAMFEQCKIKKQMKILAALITISFAVFINPMFIDDVQGDPNEVKENNFSLDNSISINKAAAVETFYVVSPAVLQNPNYGEIVFIDQNNKRNKDNFQNNLSVYMADTINSNFFNGLN